MGMLIVFWGSCMLNVQMVVGWWQLSTWCSMVPRHSVAWVCSPGWCDSRGDDGGAFGPGEGRLLSNLVSCLRVDNVQCG